MGFAYITDFRYVSCVKFAMEFNGLYMCNLEFNNENIYLKPYIQSTFTQSQWYLTSPIIKFLYTKGVIVKPVIGMYGKHSRKIEY
tara:strand:+ start:598 stop:852 length:255 start_codon:yes stop_codon:yes gene_type:complete